jgi:hypothetical protein
MGTAGTPQRPLFSPESLMRMVIYLRLAYSNHPYHTVRYVTRGNITTGQGCRYIFCLVMVLGGEKLYGPS